MQQNKGFIGYAASQQSALGSIWEAVAVGHRRPELF
jgi:hypothetical protein